MNTEARNVAATDIARSWVGRCGMVWDSLSVEERRFAKKLIRESPEFREYEQAFDRALTGEPVNISWMGGSREGD
jgi:hypothetical protein